ncbi:MAG: hypothetical protein OXI79_14795, partial [Gammaproteobacteria bacterium]|nr:hypothetical protein [Gammaproteobacteria bacterium]
MAATPPAPPEAPARPEQQQLFDSRPYLLHVAAILGTDAATWSRDHTLAESATVGAACGARYRDARIVAVVLLAMGGRGYCDLTGPQIAAAAGPKVTRQDVHKAIHGHRDARRAPKLGAVDQGLLEVAERRRGGHASHRVLVRGAVLRHLAEMHPPAGAEKSHVGAGAYTEKSRVGAGAYTEKSRVGAGAYYPREKTEATTTQPTAEP